MAIILGNDFANLSGTNLNLSGFTALQTLDYNSYNNNDLRLTSLNVSGCTALKSLICTSNNLTSLNVSGLTALESLGCSNNKLTSLNLSGNSALWWNSFGLNCSNNRLLFSTLPLQIPSTSPALLAYAPQKDMTVPMLNGTVDLSSEYLIDGYYTRYKWYYADGSLIDPSLYTETGDKFVFTGLNADPGIYCTMTNGRFPWLSLKARTEGGTETSPKNIIYLDFVTDEIKREYPVWSDKEGYGKITTTSFVGDRDMVTSIIREFFSPFNVTVVSNPMSVYKLRTDGVQVIIGGDGSWYKIPAGKPEALGVADTGSIVNASPVCFVFNNSVMTEVAIAAVHEIAHVFGLNHDENQRSIMNKKLQGINTPQFSRPLDYIYIARDVIIVPLKKFELVR